MSSIDLENYIKENFNSDNPTQTNENILPDQSTQSVKMEKLDFLFSPFNNEIESTNYPQPFEINHMYQYGFPLNVQPPIDPFLTRLRKSIIPIDDINSIERNVITILTDSNIKKIAKELANKKEQNLFIFREYIHQEMNEQFLQFLKGEINAKDFKKAFSKCLNLSNKDNLRKFYKISDAFKRQNAE